MNGKEINIRTNAPNFSDIQIGLILLGIMLLPHVPDEALRRLGDSVTVAKLGAERAGKAHAFAMALDDEAVGDEVGPLFEFLLVIVGCFDLLVDDFLNDLPGAALLNGQLRRALGTPIRTSRRKLAS